MAKQGRSLREVKAERAAQRRRALKRKRILVLIIEILILFILLGIGYIITHLDVIEQMEWFQNLVGTAV